MPARARARARVEKVMPENIPRKVHFGNVVLSKSGTDTKSLTFECDKSDDCSKFEQEFGGKYECIDGICVKRRKEDPTIKSRIKKSERSPVKDRIPKLVYKDEDNLYLFIENYKKK